MAVDQLPGSVIEFPKHATDETTGADWPPVFRGVPLTEHEKRIYGHDAKRCEQTGFIFECGSGSLPEAAQTAQFKRNLCDPVWVTEYLRSDPHARHRHPKLYAHYRNQR